MSEHQQPCRARSSIQQSRCSDTHRILNPEFRTICLPAASPPSPVGLTSVVIPASHRALCVLCGPIPRFPASHGRFGPSLSVPSGSLAQIMASLDRQETTLGLPSSSFTRPETSFARPKTSFARPETSFTRPETSFVRPKTSFVRPKTSFTRPKTSFVRPKISFTRPKTCPASPETCLARPQGRMREQKIFAESGFYPICSRRASP